MFITFDGLLLNVVLIIFISFLYQFCVFIKKLCIYSLYSLLLITNSILKFIKHDNILIQGYQISLLLRSSCPVKGSWVSPFIRVICYVELRLLIDRCGMLSARAFKMHNTYFWKQLLLWQLSGHLQLSLHDWLLMESNMLEKRIEQMKEGFEGILLNLLKFNRLADKILTFITLFKQFTSFMNSERQETFLEK